MRFRTLLTNSQNVVGVFVHNGHHKRTVTANAVVFFFNNQQPYIDRVCDEILVPKLKAYKKRRLGHLDWVFLNCSADWVLLNRYAD